MAIPISKGIQPIAKKNICATLVALAALWLGCPAAELRAAETNQPVVPRRASPESIFTARARKAFFDARRRFQNETNDAEAAWQYGRAAFDLAEWAADSDERAEIANAGIDACRAAIERAPGSAAAHYYLGMNFGQLARTKGLGALRLVGQMEQEFLAAREADPHFDYAGPDRNLGFLYRDAPSIGSIGSRTKARRHFRNAIELAPEYPENGLNLIESYLKWSSRTDAEREFKSLEKLWPEAHEK